MASSKRLIVGLGNPGEAYFDTRHNIGFRVIDELAEHLKLMLKTKGSSILGWGKWKGHPVGLAKPTTYMNSSGTAVEDLMRKNRLEPEDLLVVLDDINLPVGTIRVRERGGPGGHNGLEDIIDWLDSDRFPRLRIGIGSGFREGRQVDFVLSNFEDEEKELIDQAIVKARDATLTFVSDGIVTMMNRFST